MLKATNRTLANEVRAKGLLNCIVVGGEMSSCKRRSLGFVYVTGVSRLHNGMARRLGSLVHALIEYNYSANLPKLAARTGEGYIDY